MFLCYTDIPWVMQWFFFRNICISWFLWTRSWMPSIWGNDDQCPCTFFHNVRFSLMQSEHCLCEGMNWNAWKRVFEIHSKQVIKAEENSMDAVIRRQAQFEGNFSFICSQVLNKRSECLQTISKNSPN